MVLPYQQPGLTLSQEQTNDPSLVRALQHDLRRLGYLRRGIDGAFGNGTARAVSALRYDLLHNDGTGADGDAPIAVKNYNSGRVAAPITGILDQGLADCIADMLADPACPTLPFSATASADNTRAVATIAGQHSAVAPALFVLAIILQESNGLHFAVSTNANQDNFVVVGLDQATGAPPEQITSRGYGIGQYTLHHHPPTPREIERFIADPVGSVSLAYAVLRDKLTLAVRSPDRQAEHPGLPLRLCRYAQTDPRYQTDCVTCARNAHKVDIRTGTPVYPGANETYQPTHYHQSATYSAVPDRADFGCDWPYAVRRYNGDGIDSYHYQAEVLPRLLNLPVTPTA